MADISKIKLPNNAEYNLRDKAGRIYFVEGTQTANTAAWTGAIDLDALFDGLTIAYYLPRTSASGVTLNLTLSGGGTTGAKEVYVNGSTRMTTHYPAGSTVYLTYYSAGSISINGTATTTDRWIGNEYWNGNTYDRTYINTTFKAASATTAGVLLCGNSSGYKDLAKGAAFSIAYPILYCATAMAAGGTRSDGYIQIPMNCTKTNGNTSPAFTAYSMVFLKGAISGNTFTVDSTTMFTQTAPTSADGKYYMALGIAGNATNIFLQPSHPIFEYKNGSWHEASIGLGSLAAKSSVSASYTPAGTVSTPTITVTPTTASIGSASGWNAGSVPTLGTAIPADDITAWTTNTPSTVPTMAASEGVLTFTAGSNGTAASLSYTAKSIPNVTAVGTKPSLTITSTTVATGIDSATSTKPTFTGTAATITSS